MYLLQLGHGILVADRGYLESFFLGGGKKKLFWVRGLIDLLKGEVSQKIIGATSRCVLGERHNRAQGRNFSENMWYLSMGVYIVMGKSFFLPPGVFRTDLT